MDPLSLNPDVFASSIESYHPEIRDFFCEGRKDFSNYDSVSQGEIGDCWLLGPIAALSRASRLRGLLQDNFTINPEDKTYSIVLYDERPAAPTVPTVPTAPTALNASNVPVSKTFTIDGKLLYIPKVGSYKADLLFGGQQQFIPEKKTITLKSLWFAFIEKAVSVKLGGYHNLDGGDPDIDPSKVKQADLGFKILTGRPVTTINIDATIDFSRTIRELLASGAAIVYTTKTNAEILAEGNARTIKAKPEALDDKSGMNLLEDHVYVVDTISRDGVVQLYNPHGEFPKTTAQNKAKPLSQADAILFGKRLDIMLVTGGGGRGKSRNRKQIRRRLTRRLKN